MLYVLDNFMYYYFHLKDAVIEMFSHPMTEDELRVVFDIVDSV